MSSITDDETTDDKTGRRNYIMKIEERAVEARNGEIRLHRNEPL